MPVTAVLMTRRPGYARGRRSISQMSPATSASRTKTLPAAVRDGFTIYCERHRKEKAPR